MPIPTPPETTKIMPEECIVVSFDVEACHPGKPDIIPGSLMALGAIAAIISPHCAPFKRIYRRDDGKNYLPCQFFTVVEPRIPMDKEISEKFWAKNSEAYRWSSQNPEGIKTAFTEFTEWLFAFRNATELPIVMVALPHKYDATQLIEALTYTKNTHILQYLRFADSAELYATKHNLPLAEGKAEFKRLFMPRLNGESNLIHEPVMDSMDQLTATLKGLLYKRPHVTLQATA